MISPNPISPAWINSERRQVRRRGRPDPASGLPVPPDRATAERPAAALGRAPECPSVLTAALVPVAARVVVWPVPISPGRADRLPDQAPNRLASVAIVDPVLGGEEVDSGEASDDHEQQPGHGRGVAHVERAGPALVKVGQ